MLPSLVVEHIAKLDFQINRRLALVVGTSFIDLVAGLAYLVIPYLVLPFVGMLPSIAVASWVVGRLFAVCNPYCIFIIKIIIITVL